MKRNQLFAVGLLLLLGAGTAALVLRERTSPAHDEGHDGSKSEHASPGDGPDEPPKGPHGGRLLTEGSFGVELTIFERGVPPEFRAFLFENAKALPADAARLTVRLRRLGGRIDTIGFSPAGDYLVGDKVVEEPHSFDVEVIGSREGRDYRWEYGTYEGRTTLTPEAIRSSGVVVEPAGPARIKNTLKVYGEVVQNEERTTQVIPRYSGLLKETKKRLGDAAEKGEVLAVVESNESLQSYELRAPFSGTVVEKHFSAGAFLKDGEPIYLLSDLGTVWADLNVPRKDAARVKAGQAVTVYRDDEPDGTSGTISYVSPVGGGPTQTVTARVVLDNRSGAWRPGLFVTATVLLEEVEVAVAVKVSALQTFRDWDVVFVRDGNTFEVRPLDLGRRDATWVEVLSGIEPGQEYVAENSFIIKADIGKAGATHDH